MSDLAAERRSAEPAFLTAAEASEATGITVDSLAQYRQLRKRGVRLGPDFVKFGRAVLYPSDAVDAFLAKRGRR